MNASLHVLRQPAARQTVTLLVMLPGAYMTPQQFVEAGFTAALADAEVAADLAIPALDLAAITGGTALEILRREVIVPAKAQGYDRIWLGGISLGGFMALAYAEAHPGEIDGLCLLAPYPGSRLTTNEISALGGFDAWQATEQQLTDPEFRVWRWLKTRPADLPIYCAYGREDRFAKGMDMLAATLPADGVETMAGGHEWPVWLSLWRRFLAGAWLESGEKALSRS